MTPVPDAPLLVLFNAGAGRHAEEDAAQPIRAVLEASGRAFRLIPLQPGRSLPQQIRAAVQQACEQGAIVVAAGGDGTISTVAHEVAGSGCVLGVIPQGTLTISAVPTASRPTRPKPYSRCWMAWCARCRPGA